MPLGRYFAGYLGGAKYPRTPRARQSPFHSHHKARIPRWSQVIFPLAPQVGQSLMSTEPLKEWTRIPDPEQ